MNRLGIIMVLLTGFLSIQGQESMPFSCGTENLEHIKQDMLTNREIYKGFQFQRGSISYIPVKVFLVALNDGTNSPSVINTLRMICQLNKAYLDQEIQFYIKEIKTLNNTAISNTPKSGGGALQMQLNKDNRAINIFIVNTIEESVAGYYIGPPASSSDYIVIDKNYMADVRVAPHEVGHYLSLPHTFHGWDRDAWNPAIHGNPVSKFAPDGITINEFADSSNCGPKNVGDGFCDTPADYNFASNNCSYTLNAQDPNGKLVKPMTNNFMNYFFGCSKYIFTPQQKVAVQTSFISNGRKDIRGTSPVSTTEITTTTKLLSPANGSPTVSADSIHLDWEEVASASSYLVQYDVVPTFELLVQSSVTKDTKLTISKLTQNRTYYWRVIPFNDYSTCFLDPIKFTFKAGALTAVNDIPEVKSFAIYPNPVIGNKIVSLQIESRVGFSGILSLNDLSGKKVFFQSNEKFTNGITSKTLDVSKLPAGVYIISIATNKGIGSRKLIIY